VTAQRRRDAMRAIKLADGTYLIRSGCCRPGRCAPAAGIRCCRSAVCACDWPVSATAYQGPLKRRPRYGLAVAIGASVAAGVGTLAVCGALAWFVVANIERIALAAGALLVLFIGFGLWSSGGCETTVNVKHRH
jgi:hypothetical protein